jgi:hypothetical protein
MGGRLSAVTTERDDPNAEGHGRGLRMQFEVSAFQQHGFYLGLGQFCIPNSVHSKTYRIGPSLIDPHRPIVLHHGRHSGSYLPELGSDLVAALSGLNVHDLSHDDWWFVTVVGNRERTK